MEALLRNVIDLFDMHECGEKLREVKRFKLKMNPYYHLSSSFRRSYLGNKEEASRICFNMSRGISAYSQSLSSCSRRPSDLVVLLTYQMPRGVPVATVAINNSTNAALLAIRMLRISDTVLSQGCVSTRKTLDKRTWLKERNLSTKAGNHI